MTHTLHLASVILHPKNYQHIFFNFMEIVYFSFIVFLFMLAVFDLVVGVSNDAVNFLNSAIGAKVARFRTILIIASIGVFVGATMSNGMMDIARHGIFQPQMFSFKTCFVFSWQSW